MKTDYQLYLDLTKEQVVNILSNKIVGEGAKFLASGQEAFLWFIVLAISFVGVIFIYKHAPKIISWIGAVAIAWSSCAMILAFATMMTYQGHVTDAKRGIFHLSIFSDEEIGKFSSLVYPEDLVYLDKELIKK